MKEQVFIVVICVVGILMISYGLYKDDNFVFFCGVAFVVGGYLLIRRKLKEAMANKS
jgi:hypothetical protein